MARVVIEKLHKDFKGVNGESVGAVRDFSLTVEDGEFLVLVGPSGCGKTTTLRLLAGLEAATSGTVSIDGQMLDDVPPKDRDIAMVFQHHALYPHMTAYENMAFGLTLRKIPTAEIERRVRDAAGLLGLSSLLERKPQALSGGERQRVALGRAIVRRPKVFLFDEPLSNLDAPMRLQMRAEIAQLHRRLAATMIYVTHDQSEAMSLGDRLVVMKAGAIQQVAAPMQIYGAPANLFAAGFIGSPPMNFFRGALVADSGALRFVAEGVAGNIDLRLPDALASGLRPFVGKNVILGLRPEHFLMEHSATASSAEHAIAATVEAVEPMGPEIQLRLTTGAHGFVARVPACALVVANEKVTLAVDLRQARFFDPVTEKSI